MTPKELLENHSGKIVAVGDTFDHYRSSVVGETMEQYLARTEQYWKHISEYVTGNHDSRLLTHFKDKFNASEFYKEGSVLAFHGHQLWFAFNKDKVKNYEKNWFTSIAPKSIFWDIEEWACKAFNKYFLLNKRQMYIQAYTNVRTLHKAGLLSKDLDTIITGHTHIPFDIQISFLGKNYRVVNLGCPLHGKKFNPVYIKKIDRWFVSDLHLGTIKSILN